MFPQQQCDLDKNEMKLIVTELKLNGRIFSSYKKENALA